jgi:hypothetical protein
MRYLSLLVIMVLAGVLAGCGPMLKELSQELDKIGNSQSTAIPAPAPAVYCYNSLGSVTCYEQPKPAKEVGAYVGSSAVSVADPNPDKIMHGTTTIVDPATPSLPPLPEQMLVDNPQLPTANGIAEDAATTPNVETKTGVESPPDNKPMGDPFLFQRGQYSADAIGQEKLQPKAAPVVDPKSVKQGKKKKKKNKPKQN